MLIDAVLESKVVVWFVLAAGWAWFLLATKTVFKWLVLDLDLEYGSFCTLPDVAALVL